MNLTDRPWSLFSGLSLDERCLFATMTACLIVLVNGPWWIDRLRSLGARQVVRDDGPKSHLAKHGTPTMGGLLILLGIVIAAVLWGTETPAALIYLMTLILFGAIGLIDDRLKLIQRHSRGIGARRKFILQAASALLVLTFLLILTRGSWPVLHVPFANGDLRLPAWLDLSFAWVVIVGTSNAVNLTDGLDGLAALQVALIMSGLMMAVGLGWMGAVHSLDFVPSLTDAGSSLVMASATVGACLGFLWFNGHPAQIFMGDVGSLALGAVLGLFAVETGLAFFLFVMGGVLVVETVSVAVQVISFKLTRKRIFRMAPLHHHYELAGWPETKVLVRFAVVTLLLIIVGLLAARQ